VERITELVDKGTKHAPLKQIARLAKGLGQKYRGTPFIAAGIVIPGLVRQDGTVWAPNVPGWQRIHLARLLEQELAVPVVVESDRNGAVLGEVFSPRGTARGKSHVISLIVGTGIGAGIISDGKLFRGAHELSGCAGWMSLSLEGPVDIEQLGYLEAYAAGPGVARMASAAILAGNGGAMTAFGAGKITTYDLADLARKGDGPAREIWRREGQLLGVAVANIVSLFDPEMVVLGGGLIAVADRFWDELKRTALRRTQPIAAKHVKLVLSKLGNDANLLGAAYLARQIASGSTPLLEEVAL
jgi:glucokinase